MPRSAAKKTSNSGYQGPSDSAPELADASLGETETKILEAAFRRLAEEGYAALSVREIAKDAGVNHALINYHFGSKDQLVIAVLDHANRRLLERQERMYGTPAGFAEKWAEARAFYAADLASGFVRVQAELWAASLSNPALREKFLPRILAWKEIVLGGVRDALQTAERCGVRLPKPFTAEVIASLISEFWIGMEFADLIGASEKQLHHRATLDALEELLTGLDDLARKKEPSSRLLKSGPKRKGGG
jgi:AcrR family transcriptional regulator